MLGGDPIKTGYEFIDARVVLHCAGAQRIHTEVDGVVPRRKAREVPEYFDLAHFGKPFDARPPVIRAKSLGAIGPMIFSRKSWPLSIFTERGISTVNSLKNGASNVRRTPGIFSNSESANCAFEKFCSAISRKPSLPSSVRCTVAASAQSA